jgi:hypothetical protein
VDHVETSKLLGSVGKFTNLEQFKSLASELISRSIKIISLEEAAKLARNLNASIFGVLAIGGKKTLSGLHSNITTLEPP